MTLYLIFRSAVSIYYPILPIPVDMKRLESRLFQKRVWLHIVISPPKSYEPPSGDGVVVSQRTFEINIMTLAVISLLANSRASAIVRCA